MPKSYLRLSKWYLPFWKRYLGFWQRYLPFSKKHLGFSQSSLGSCIKIANFGGQNVLKSAEHSPNERFNRKMSKNRVFGPPADAGNPARQDWNHCRWPGWDTSVLSGRVCLPAACAALVETFWSGPAERERRRHFRTHDEGTPSGDFPLVRKRCRAALATAVQNGVHGRSRTTKPRPARQSIRFPAARKRRAGVWP